MTKSEELVMAYATQTGIIREAKAFIKSEMRKLGEDETFCEDMRQQYEASPLESCIRRRIYRYSDDEMCDSCKVIWPHVEAKYKAKQERAKIMQKINALGKRLLKDARRKCIDCGKELTRGEQTICDDHIPF